MCAMYVTMIPVSMIHLYLYVYMYDTCKSSVDLKRVSVHFQSHGQKRALSMSELQVLFWGYDIGCPVWKIALFDCRVLHGFLGRLFALQVS